MVILNTIHLLTVSKHMKQKLIEIKEEREESTIMSDISIINRTLKNKQPV